MRAWVVGLSMVVAVGCYDARKSCEYTCASSSACPDGLMCAAGHCVTNASETCSGGGDGSNGSDGSGSNGWSFVPTNIDLTDPYVANPSPPDWIVGTPLVYNTDSPSPIGTPMSQSSTLLPNTLRIRVLLIRVGQFMVPSDSSLMFRGNVPVILIANSAVIAGPIYANSGSGTIAVPGLCGTYLASVGTSCGGGGPGGGFDGRGGAGGGCVNAQSQAGGGSNGDDALVPLRGGCDGANGATSGAGLGGGGGGAVEISARDSFTMSGGLAALVAGGGAAGNAASNGAGGGGGGAGGGILVESDVVNLSGIICANGGGGGEGHGATQTGMQSVATEGCSPLGSGLAALGATDGGDGGPGGSQSMVAGAGGSATISGRGGGGGGGAAGRIRIRARTQTGSAMTSPAPRNDQLP